MVARYPGDGELYRGKVTAVRSGQTKFDVLFIDYGNEERDLSLSDLHAWDTLYELIQPQAHLCCLQDFPEAWKLSAEQEAFDAAMRSQQAMKMTVEELRASPSSAFSASLTGFGKEVELVVSLTTKGGKNVTDVLKTFLDLRGNLTPVRTKLSSCPVKDLLNNLKLTPPRLVSPPHPLHLKECLQVGLPSDSPPSPVHPKTTANSVMKVTDWLEKNEDSNSEGTDVSKIQAEGNESREYYFGAGANN